MHLMLHFQVSEHSQQARQRRNETPQSCQNINSCEAAIAVTVKQISFVQNVSSLSKTHCRRKSFVFKSLSHSEFKWKFTLLLGAFRKHLCVIWQEQVLRTKESSHKFVSKQSRHCSHPSKQKEINCLHGKKRQFHTQVCLHSGTWGDHKANANASLEKTGKNGKKRIKVPLQNGKRVTVQSWCWRCNNCVVT